MNKLILILLIMTGTYTVMQAQAKTLDNEPDANNDYHYATNPGLIDSDFVFGVSSLKQKATVIRVKGEDGQERQQVVFTTSSEKAKAHFDPATMKEKVIFRVLVDEEGNYVKHKVLTEGKAVFMEEGEEVVRKMNYSPASDEAGKPVKSWITVPVVFRFKQ